MADMSITPDPAGVPQFTLRHRLALALEHAGVSVGDIAELLGISRNTVGNYLHGRTIPKVSVLRVWAMRCGVPFEWLSEGIEPSETGPDGGSGLHTPSSGWDTAAESPAKVIPLRPSRAA